MVDGTDTVATVPLVIPDGFHGVKCKEVKNGARLVDAGDRYKARSQSQSQPGRDHGVKEESAKECWKGVSVESVVELGLSHS